MKQQLNKKLPQRSKETASVSGLRNKPDIIKRHKKFNSISDHSSITNQSNNSLMSNPYSRLDERNSNNNLAKNIKPRSQTSNAEINARKIKLTKPKSMAAIQKNKR